MTKTYDLPDPAFPPPTGVPLVLPGDVEHYWEDFSTPADHESASGWFHDGFGAAQEGGDFCWVEKKEHALREAGRYVLRQRSQAKPLLFVLLTGNPVDGFKAYGPFKSIWNNTEDGLYADEAADQAGVLDEDWWSLDLEVEG